MGTDIHYNGVTLQNVLTTQWDERVAYDPSDTDREGHTLNLAFRGIIHDISQANIGPAGGGTDTIASYQQVSESLRVPRKELKIQMNGKTILHVLPAGGLIGNPKQDIDNGPKPQDFKLIHIASNKTFRFEWSIKVKLTGCTGVYQVISNRWSIRETMDANHFVERSIRGRIKFLSSAAFANHQFKRMVVPSLEKGFRRTHLTFNLHESGLEAEYEITDRQVHVSAPYPAKSMDVTHTEATEGEGKYTTNLNVRMVGGPESDQNLMIARAMQVIDRRINFFAERQEGKLFPAYTAISSYFGTGENAINVSMNLIRIPAKIGEFLTSLRRDVWTVSRINNLPALPGEPEPYVSTISRAPEIFGFDSQGGTRDPAAYLFLIHCYLQDVCVPEHRIRIVSSQGASAQEADKIPQTTVAGQVVDSLSQGETLWSDSATQQTGVQTVARMKTRYVTTQMRAACPIASPVARVGGVVNAVGPGTAFIDLAPPQTQRVIDVEVERVGARPKIPEPVDSYKDGTITAKLLSFELGVNSADLTADGQTPIFKQTAEYIYGLDRAPTSVDSLRVGTLETTAFPATAEAVKLGEIVLAALDEAGQ